MAAKGYNMMLISRNLENLSKTKEDIKSKYNKSVREIRILAVDFSREDIYEDIENELDGIQKSGGNFEVLINNVGVTYSPNYFTKVKGSWNSLKSLINVNVIACTRMIFIVLPWMEKKRKGVILNISSITGSYPSPFLSGYSASKAYMDFLSRALQMEYRDHGIIIQSVLPGYVMTKLSKKRKTSFFIPSPEDFVKGSLKTVGLEDRTFGYWTHKLQMFYISDLACLFVSDYNSKVSYSYLLHAREKYYKKHGIKDD